ncbi:hypothetical protein EDD22DRAFT_850174 [Suillus occidentalis]|nr:hypothetical protein EDD22DRAFT_850174 [Suillus occidentalis]
MLYGMIYGSSNDWKQERGWIVRFLSDGMTSTEDEKVLKRRHTWELLSSLVQSSVRDQALRRAVLEATTFLGDQATWYMRGNLTSAGYSDWPFAPENVQQQISKF